MWCLYVHVYVYVGYEECVVSMVSTVCVCAFVMNVCVCVMFSVCLSICDEYVHV